MTQKELNQKLGEAITLQDKAQVEELLKAGADINGRSCHIINDKPHHPYRKTLCEPIMVLPQAIKGSPDVYDVLLRQKPDLSVQDASGYTPLRLAAVIGKIEIIRLLLQYGADVTEQNQEGVAPLAYAAANDRYDAVKLFIEYGADINLRDERGATAIMEAAQIGGIEVMQLLLDNGAEIEDKDNQGKTVLQYAENAGTAGWNFDMTPEQKTMTIAFIKQAILSKGIEGKGEDKVSSL